MDTVGRKHSVDCCRAKAQVVVSGRREVIDERHAGLLRDSFGVQRVDRGSLSVVPEGVCGGLGRDYDKSSRILERPSRVLHVSKRRDPTSVPLEKGEKIGGSHER